MSLGAFVRSIQELL